MNKSQKLITRVAKSFNAPRVSASFSTFTGNKTEEGNFKVTLFPGHGIGPEISDSVEQIFNAANVPIEWERHDIGLKPVTADGSLITQEALDSVLKNEVGLKGPLMTPIGKGFRSLNVTLRRNLSLYSNVRPCKTIAGLDNRYENVDLVTIRENTEGEYSGLEHVVTDGVVENLKMISKKACMRIAEYAFKYAQDHGRKKVTACHKATIMTMGDGLFLDCCAEVSKRYPDIIFEERQVDTAAMILARDPSKFDVMVMPNLYGDILSDLCAGLIGGLGLTPSGNIGEHAAVFEAVHGTAPDIAGKGFANPTALLLSSVMMLRHMQLQSHADMIENAIFATLKDGKHLTRDLGGKTSTGDYTRAVIGNFVQN